MTLRSASIVLTLLGAAAALVPWVADSVGLSVPVGLDVEMIDHVIPGILVILASVAGWSVRSRSDFWPHAVWTGICFVAGMWMTTTHLPLLADAAGAELGWAEALLHSLPGVLIVLVSFSTLLRITSGDSGTESSSSGRERADRQ